MSRRAMIAGCVSLALGSPAFAAAQSPTETAPATVTASPAATPGASAETPAASSATAELGEIVWAREIDPATNEPTRRATGFIITDPAIFAVVPVTRIEAGAVVTAAWSFNGIAVPELDTSITAETGYQDGWISFELAKPEGAIWPTGEYGIVVSVDGEAMVESSIMVRVPPA